jgi:hypothetical protein
MFGIMRSLWRPFSEPSAIALENSYKKGWLFKSNYDSADLGVSSPRRFLYILSFISCVVRFSLPSKYDSFVSAASMVRSPPEILYIDVDSYTPACSYMIPVSYSITTFELKHYEMLIIMTPRSDASFTTFSNTSSVFQLPAPYVSMITPRFYLTSEINTLNMCVFEDFSNCISWN